MPWPWRCAWTAQSSWMNQSSRTPKYRAHSPSAIPTSNCAPGSMAFPTRTSAATRCKHPADSFTRPKSSSSQRVFWHEHQPANRAPPGEKQDDADQNERQAQAGPQAKRAPASMEAEPGTERKTNNPIRGEVAEHGRARIARTAESSSRDRLDAIEQLEGGAGSEQKNGAVNDSLIRCVHSRDPSGK